MQTKLSKQPNLYLSYRPGDVSTEHRQSRAETVGFAQYQHWIQSTVTFTPLDCLGHGFQHATIFNLCCQM